MPLLFAFSLLPYFALAFYIFSCFPCSIYNELIIEANIWFDIFQILDSVLL